MKKKGLIISTIVMVVVLIASLTTTTYAWFTTTAQSKVSEISVGVTTNSKVMIGVSKTNAFTSSAATESNFRNGNVTFNESGEEKWTTGTNGLGTSINTGLQMTALTKACFPSSAYTVENDATTYTIPVPVQGESTAAQLFETNKGNQWIKSEGEAETLGLAAQYQFAHANNYTVSSTKNPGDYLDITFGVRAAQSNINKIALVVGFENANDTNLGMATAFNYWYQVESTGTASGLLDLYGDLHYDAALADAKPKNNISGSPVAWAEADGLSWTPEDGDATVVIPIKAAATASDALSTTAIYQIHLIIFLNGWDSDCNNSAASVGIAEGSKIHLDFITVEKSA